MNRSFYLVIICRNGVPIATLNSWEKSTQDPCNRFIVATAVRCGLTIVNPPDQHIAQYKNVDMVW